MSRVRLFLVFLIMAMIAGCNRGDAEPGTDAAPGADGKAFAEAVLESGIPTGWIVHTEKRDDYAFSLYHSPEGFGILQFSKGKDGWAYDGRASCDYSLDEEKPPISSVQSTWVKGDDLPGGANAYATVLFGEVNDPEIRKVVVQTDGGSAEAELVSGKEVTFWYWIPDNPEGDGRLFKVSGYSGKGERLYEYEYPDE